MSEHFLEIYNLPNKKTQKYIGIFIDTYIARNRYNIKQLDNQQPFSMT